MATTTTYLTSSTFTPTASITSATIQVWGAGGHGNVTGVGGSGGAYASVTSSLTSGSAYAIVVGQPSSTNGGSSSLSHSGTILVQAAGGNYDGTIANQASLLTGSVTFSGGLGGVNVTGSGFPNGSGGGSSASPSGSGVSGATDVLTGASYSQSGMNQNVSNTSASPYSNPELPPIGGVAPAGGGNGGNGGHYKAGSVAGVIPAQSGQFPGGGGGGTYSTVQTLTDNSAAGAQGLVAITY